MRFPDRLSAIREAQNRGFSVPCGEGYCGDGPLGSRLYYRRPGAELNSNGWPFDWAEVNSLAGTWAVTIFIKAPTGTDIVYV